MPSEEPVEGRCNATCRDGGHCTQYPVRGSKRCRMHGGTDNGAPEGNTNAVSHGAFSDMNNLYSEVFSDRECDLVDRIYDSWRNRYIDVHGDEPIVGIEMKLFNIAVKSVTEMRVENWYTEKPDELETGTPYIDRETHISESGTTYYRYKSSPAIAAINHISRYNRQTLEDLKLLPDDDDDMDVSNSFNTVNINYEVV